MLVTRLQVSSHVFELVSCASFSTSGSCASQFALPAGPNSSRRPSLAAYSGLRLLLRRSQPFSTPIPFAVSLQSPIPLPLICTTIVPSPSAGSPLSTARPNRDLFFFCPSRARGKQPWMQVNQDCEAAREVHCMRGVRE
ncbi:hypothetical protein FA09DRAFT_12618 [Tilletiopsis washingtonensis]|uniref:Uncharacterized protein n=1 Tax=Tilletiopsis washingtonensis TaxID=58919 RepID=A0A316ZJR8_9BASI|nr:hypothetical protein FA09DRAFT_12618 [Tilletiopsis washingtonensis]PWO01379.1 hypothetical protein FA09DRAFT_12618 [Tilletiopsis washingtonensis]